MPTKKKSANAENSDPTPALATDRSPVSTQPAVETITLFHFTRPEYLPSILLHGIDTGEISLNMKEGIHAISLTNDGNPASQRKWTWGAPEKMKIRLKVAMDPADPLLLKWKFFKDRFKIESKWFKTLTECGGGDPYQWFVYLGVIPPQAIVEIWDTDLQRNLTHDEIERLRRSPEVRGHYYAPLKRLSLDQALRSPR